MSLAWRVGREQDPAISQSMEIGFVLLLLVLPVAISAALEIGADPRSFAIGVMLAASISFIAPLEPSCVIVYGPGRYRFIDFVRMGGGLTLILLIVVLPLVPVFWPLK